MSAPLVFVTGQMRSGTTLIDRLLWNVPGVDCFSQPLPLLLSQIKAAFLQENGAPAHACAYPLNDQQFENTYAEGHFLGFLQNPELDPALLKTAMTAMRDYSGQKFKPHNPQTALDTWQGGDLANFAAHYFVTHTQKPAQDIKARAWKETNAEDYLPYFLASGMKAILVIRDPRDVATSLYYGQGGQHVGTARPLLFMARQWRKSAAWFSRYAKDENVLCVRYEDLVANPESHRQSWQDWLGIKNASGDFSLQSQSGKSWAGNSSFDRFDGISTKAVGRHRTVLGDDERSFIEALCYGEMRLTGYAPDIKPEAVLARLQDGPARDYLERETLAHYAYDESRKHEECERWKNITHGDTAFDPAMFLFEDHFQALRKITSKG
ncbi:MAG: hypothetical protein COA84_02955 [Robiginitomaculum sp.]|nr:MAG: hypothetical protein COA84_02955 [Robiginitomaculum sp.]